MFSSIMMPSLLIALGTIDDVRPATPAVSCTEQWARHGHTTQKQAAAFAQKCLTQAGGTDKKLTTNDIAALLTAVIPDNDALTQLEPTDITDFCPHYFELTATQRAAFWRRLIAAMIEKESGGQTASAYWEDSQSQFSLGLLQLSLADEKYYHCGFVAEVDLTDPERISAAG